MKQTHKTIYDNPGKTKWRERIYSVLSEANCHSLIDLNGNFPYKWIEPTGDNAIPFKQLINTGRINESQLIGIDLDPKNKQHSIENIEECKKMFPEAEFYAEDWVDYCEYFCDHNDIGYIIHDFYTATKNSEFERMLNASITLASRCKGYIGEVLLVINCDLTARFNNNTEEGFVKNIEKVFYEHKDSYDGWRYLKVYPESVYTYKGKSNGSTMATAILIL